MKNIKNLLLSLPQQHKMILGSLCFILFFLLVLPSEDASASRQNERATLLIGQRYPLNLPTPADVPGVVVDNAARAAVLNDTPANPLTTIDTSLTWQSAKVKAGDSLAKILKRLGFSSRTTYEISNAQGDDTNLLKKLNVGDSLQIGHDEYDKLVTLVYPLDKTKTLYVQLTQNGYQSFKEVKTVETRIAYAHGKISSSFWNSAIEAGMDDSQIISLANIFGWDIDFAIDIRAGDSFNIIFENRYVEGEFVGQGDILAAEFVNQNETFQAIRFTDGEYYTPEGKSMRKAFLRAPVNFKYISSNFNPKRFHPIQKRTKPHNGTDYRANTGTPVMAAGSGKVTQSTYNKYNGNYVFIQHGDGIETKYLHFSKRAVKKGDRVKQGQVIGYVGTSGMSEAPHLHYEFLLNGVHRNPRTVKLPDANPIEHQYQQAFKQLSQQRLQELAGSKRTLLAMQTNHE